MPGYKVVKPSELFEMLDKNARDVVDATVKSNSQRSVSQLQMQIAYCNKLLKCDLIEHIRIEVERRKIDAMKELSFKLAGPWLPRKNITGFGRFKSGAQVYLDGHWVHESVADALEWATKIAEHERLHALAQLRLKQASLKVARRYSKQDTTKYWHSLLCSLGDDVKSALDELWTAQERVTALRSI